MMRKARTKLPTETGQELYFLRIPRYSSCVTTFMALKLTTLSISFWMLSCQPCPVAGLKSGSVDALWALVGNEGEEVWREKTAAKSGGS